MPGFILILVTFALMWVLFILPQQRRVKQHQALIQALEVGDEVVTAGGVFGTITSATDEVLTLRIADGVEVRILRGAISRKTAPDGGIEPIDAAEAAELEAAEADLSDVADELPAEGDPDDGTWPQEQPEQDQGRGFFRRRG